MVLGRSARAHERRSRGIRRLAADYAWARHVLRKTKDGLNYARRKAEARKRI